MSRKLDTFTSNSVTQLGYSVATFKFCHSAQHLAHFAGPAAGANILDMALKKKLRAVAACAVCERLASPQPYRTPFGRAEHFAALCSDASGRLVTARDFILGTFRWASRSTQLSQRRPPSLATAPRLDLRPLACLMKHVDRLSQLSDRSSSAHPAKFAEQCPG